MASFLVVSSPFASLAFPPPSTAAIPPLVVAVVGLPALQRPQFSCSSSCPREESKSTVKIAHLPAIAAATLVTSHPALALVDDRLSTEGTGLSLGISSPLLGWILLGVAALIWSLYFAYTSTLPDNDDDSGLAL